MKIDTLIQMVRAGKKPVVKLISCPWDESFGEKGMLAEVTAAEEYKLIGGWKFTFNYNRFRETNEPYMSHDFYLSDEDGIRLDRKTGTAIEAGLIEENDLTEVIYFDKTDDIPIELADDNELLVRYVNSGLTISYTKWLENRVTDLELEYIPLD